jgi:hypothetical protein
MANLISDTEHLPTEERLIDRTLIEEYCKNKDIGVHDLLQDFVVEGLDDFSIFLSSKGIKNEIAPSTKVLLNGSADLFFKFEPRISTGGPNENKETPLIYASDDPDYAMFMAIIKLREGSASVNYNHRTEKIQCFVHKDFINGPSQIVNGYVYILDQSKFEMNGKHHFTCPTEQEPIFIIPIKPKDLRTDIVVKL